MDVDEAETDETGQNDGGYLDVEQVEKYERGFLIAAFAFVCGAVIALIVSIVGHHASLPEPAGRIDPDEVATTAPFDEPGLYETGDNTYDLVMVAQAWQWTPEEVTVPEGAEVHIIATTRDVVHGLLIPNTNNGNAMVVPGQITEVDLTFDDTGVHSIICHEYCGIGHHNMGGRIIVE